MPLQLRDYQSTAVDDIRNSYRAGNRAPIFVLPTGGGKTTTFVYIADQAAKRGTRICILVHRDHLVWQTSAELKLWGVRHGIIMAGIDELPEHDVQVASVMSLARRLDRWNDFDLLIVDECHHAVAATWKKVISHYENAKVLGVTATPARLDGKGLGHLFDELIFGPTMSELISMEFLAPYRMFVPAEQVNTKGLRKRAGDYSADEAAALMDKRKITGDAVSHFQRHLNGAPSIAFCTTVEHAQHVADEFRARGFQSTVMTGKTDTITRRQMLADLACGKLHVLTSCEVISEGTDVPTCYGSILLRPTASLTMFLQQCGRALRPKPRGQSAILLDHAGNSRLHGLPHEDRAWSLMDGIQAARADGGSAIRTCRECFAIYERTKDACPVCGTPYLPEAGSGIPRQVAGDLIEAAGMDFNGHDVRDLPFTDVMKQAKTLDQLLVIERVKGYKPGWARHYHEARQAAHARKSGKRSWRFQRSSTGQTVEVDEKPW